MALYYLTDAIREAYYRGTQRRLIETAIIPSQREAVDLFKKIVKGYAGLGAVQGPPGTGKTSVFDIGMRDIIDEILSGPEKKLLIYIAPTNHLVVEAFMRFVSNLFNKGFDINTILDLIRVYGSKISPCRPREKKVEIDDKQIDCDDFKKLMKNIDVRTVRFVFATEYQRVSPKIMGEPDEIRFVVDEASKTPFFRVFLSIAGKIIRNPGAYYPKSMIVLGDPQQAITIQEEFRLFNIQLLMEYVASVLSRRNLDDKYFKFLDTTFRLPGPTEHPISRGFYEGKLRAYKSFSERYRDLVRGLRVEDILDKARKRLAGIRSMESSRIQRIIDAIDEALTTGKPLVVFKTKRFPPGDTYDPDRVKIAYISGLYLSIISQIVNPEQPLYKIGITSPYSDLTYNAGYNLRKNLLEARLSPYRNIVVSTVQGIIGGEADVIITMLGKEWLAHNEPGTLSYSTGLLETMYFREHQVLNVQLSRHRLIEVIIGNIDSLQYHARRALKEAGRIPEKYIRDIYRKAGKAIQETVEGIKALQEQDYVVEVSMIRI